VKKEKKPRSTINLTTNIWKALIISGIICLLFSVINPSILLGYVGLGLIFWGTLLIFIRSEKYVKHDILIKSVGPSLNQINQMINNFNFDKKSVYLPPTISNLKNCKVLLFKQRINFENNLSDQIRNIQKIINQPEILLLEPKGKDLLGSLEEKIKDDFINIDLTYVEKNLSKLIIDNYELCEKITINTYNNSESTKIYIKIHNSIFNELYETIFRSSTTIFDPCPLVSAIGCMLSKVTGNPVIINNLIFSKHNQIIEIHYETIKIKTQKAISIEKDLELKKSIPLQISTKKLKISSTILLFVALGLMNLLIVSYVTYSDVAIWGKDLFDILFGSRVAEFISLGIGMRIINYLILGFALLISAYILYKKERVSKS